MRADALLVLVAWLGCAHALSFNCSHAPAHPVDRRLNTTRPLRVAHLNAEWLFLEKWNKRWSSLAEAEEHVDAIAAALQELDADVISLAEVEDCNALRALCGKMDDATYASFLVQGTDTATGQNMGLLTRVDITTPMVRSSARVAYPVSGDHCGCSGSCGQGTSAVSKHYITTMEPVGLGPVHLVGAHLLAFPDDPNRCVQREAQASVLQGIVAGLFAKDGPQAQIIVLGDFNDYDGQVLDVAHSVPISRTLALLKDALPLLTGDELANVAINVEQTRRYTAYYSPTNACMRANSSSTSIDHVLLSQALQQRQVDTHFRNHIYNPPCSAPLPFSDHWPIVVDLK